MFLKFLGNIFASWEANFISATMFPEVGKQRNIGMKHDVSATMFPRPRALFVHYAILALRLGRLARLIKSHVKTG